MTGSVQDLETDVLVFGSGMGGLSVSLLAAKAGLAVTLCEKALQLGGTTATSAGMVWIPGSRQSKAAGIEDSPERVRAYLNAELGDFRRPDQIDAFVDDCAAALAALESETEVAFNLIPSPDYHPDQVGGSNGGRSLVVAGYDGRRLGRDFSLVRAPNPHLMALGGMMVAYNDLGAFLKPFASVQSFKTVLRRLLRYAGDRLRFSRGTELSHGNALVGRFLESLRKRDVDIRVRCSLSELIYERGRVVGAVVIDDGRRQIMRARKAVVLATGGFAASEAMRRSLSSAMPHSRTLAVDENTGDGIAVAQSIGATLDTDIASPGFWTPASLSRSARGQAVTVPYGYFDRAKPGLIAVNRSGRRFVNEANSYHDLIMALFADGGESEPHYFICDTPFAKKYGFGLIRPWPFTVSLSTYKKSGYILSAGSLAELAAKAGIDAQGLAETVSRNNAFAKTGMDEDFGRGSNAYNRVWGDAGHKPNPNLGPILTPPFLALKIVPATLGTSLGLKTDCSARVLDEHDTPIEGLFACGNDQGSMMRGLYPAGGITLGPALVFAYRAVQSMEDGTRTGMNGRAKSMLA